jgi:DNA-directed RNA polymerase subunit N (RpoN/RPB10)
MFEEGIKKICDNVKLTDKQKKDEKQNLLTTLHVTNICCRGRMITYVKKIDFVK